MNTSLKTDIEAWEDEGGAAKPAPGALTVPMKGTTSQVALAERIKRQVNAEFDRVAGEFLLIASQQSDAERTGTEALLALLEDKRAAVMSREDASRFIQEWPQINELVRRMIGQDSAPR